MSLTGKTVSASYKDILQVDNSGSGLTTSLQVVKDGEGNQSCLYISDDNLKIQPENDDTAVLVTINDKDSNNLVQIDSTNDLVKALGNNVNTQFTHFGANYVDFSNVAAGTHYPVPFGGANGGASATNDVDFGTNVDPDLTFTTANTDTQYASQIVPMMWYLPNAITIDSVTHIEGADAPTGETTRMHLLSYTLTSASTSCLTAGTLLAHNSDITNAGNEQAYLSTWTVDSSDVAAGKVILCFFYCALSVNSDYSLNVTVKYHLT